MDPTSYPMSTLYMRGNRLVRELEKTIVTHWEQVPEAKIEVSSVLSKYTLYCNQGPIIHNMTIPQVLVHLDRSIKYQLSFTTPGNAIHAVPMRCNELQYLLSSIETVFEHFIAARQAYADKMIYQAKMAKQARTGNHIQKTHDQQKASYAHITNQKPTTPYVSPVKMGEWLTEEQQTENYYKGLENQIDDEYAHIMDNTTHRQWETANAFLHAGLDEGQLQSNRISDDMYDDHMRKIQNMQTGKHLAMQQNHEHNRYGCSAIPR